METDDKDGIKDSKYQPRPLEEQAISDVSDRREIYFKIKRQLRDFSPYTFDKMHIHSFGKNIDKNPIKEIRKTIKR